MPTMASPSDSPANFIDTSNNTSGHQIWNAVPSTLPRSVGGGTGDVSKVFDDDLAGFEAAIGVVIPIIYGLISVLGFIGNLLVIVVVLVSNRRRRSTTNVLVTGLAAADLVFIVICVPFTAVNYAIDVWPFGTVWCKVYQYVIHVTAHASVYTLVLMSVDRYLAVVHPIRSLTIRTARNAGLLLSIVWFIILVANISLLGDFAVFDYETEYQNRSICVYTQVLDGSSAGRIYQTAFFTFGYVVPLTIVCLLYSSLVFRLLHGNDKVAGRSTADTTGGTIGHVGCRSSETMKTRRRVTRMVVIVVAVFAVCWLPWQVASMIQVFVDTDSPVNHSVCFAAFKIASNCLAYLNSCVNPILYAFLSDNFRTGFAQACGGNGPGGAATVISRRKRGQLRGVIDRVAAADSDRTGTTGGWFRMVRRSRRMTPPSGILLMAVRHGSDDVGSGRDAATSRSMSAGTLLLPGGGQLTVASSTMTLTERMNEITVEVGGARASQRLSLQ